MGHVIREAYNRYKPQLVYLLKVVAIYLIIFWGFQFFAGITSETGRFYFKWIDEHLDIIAGFREFLLQSSAMLLALFSYDTYVEGYFFGIENGRGVKLVYGCLGIEVLAAHTALVAAYPAALTKKIKYLIGGLIMINLLNILRISGLTLAYNHRQDGLFNFINQHDLFNLIVFGLVLILYFFYVRNAQVRA